MVKCVGCMLVMLPVVGSVSLVLVMMTVAWKIVPIAKVWSASIAPTASLIMYLTNMLLTVIAVCRAVVDVVAFMLRSRS